MTDRQITVYLSVAGPSEEHLYNRVTELLKKMECQVIDVSAMAPVFPVSDAFQAAVTDLIRRSNVFIGILGGDRDPTPEQTDGVVIETGRRPLEIEYEAAMKVGVPLLVYAGEILQTSGSWLSQFAGRLANSHTVQLFEDDDELLKRILLGLVPMIVGLPIRIH